MSTKYKYLLCLVCGFLFATMYPGGKSQASNNNSKIVIRGSENYPPFEFINEAGEPEGFNVDIMKALMKELGYDYDLKLGNWNQAVSDINEKKVDVLLGMIYSPERAESVRFSVPTCIINRNIITRKSDGYHSIKDLHGKELIVEKGGWLHRHLLQQKIPCKIIESNNIFQSIETLNKGKHDAVLANDLVAIYAMNKMGVENMSIKEMGIAPQNYSIVVNQDHDKLLYQINLGLHQLKSSGVYDQIYNKWFGIYESHKNWSTIFFIFIVFLGIASLLGAFVWLLHKQVRRSTRLLQYAKKEVGIAIAAGKISAWSYTIRTRVVTSLHGESVEDPQVSIDQIYKSIHPDDVEMVKREIESLTKKEKHEADIFFRMRRWRERFYRHIETKMVYVEATKELPERIVGTLKDVTEKIMTEQKLEEFRLKSELIIKTNDIVLIQYDVIKKVFIRINEGETAEDQKTYGIDEYLDLVFPEDKPMALRFVSDLNEAKEIRIDTEFRIISTDKNYNWYSITATAYKFDEQGKIISYLGLRRNNNKWKAINNDLILLREKADAANRLKSAFLANMSHEIRTPLNAIVGFSELVMDTEDQEERHTYMEIVKTNNELLLKLINDILDLSRVESGYVSFNFTSFDFPIFFQELAASLEIKTTPNVELTCINQYDSLRICSDKTRISQVIINFVTNAFKFTANGSITLDYVYENEGIRVSVTDTGIGIAKENFSRVFERFEKLNDFAQGTGLGLSICKVIIEALQGKIGVESELGIGSVFWFWIPCDLDLEGKEMDVEIPQYFGEIRKKKPLVVQKTESVEPQISPNKRTVLIADDIDNNFMIISAALKGSYNVIRAKDGMDAVNLTYKHNPDIILMDMKMPIMGGLDATKEIRRFNPDVPIIALTAYVFDTNKQEALQAGCNEFMTKPIKREMLIHILDQFE